VLTDIASLLSILGGNLFFFSLLKRRPSSLVGPY